MYGTYYTVELKRLKKYRAKGISRLILIFERDKKEKKPIKNSVAKNFLVTIVESLVTQGFKNESDGISVRRRRRLRSYIAFLFE